MLAFINPREVVFCGLLSQQDLIGRIRKNVPPKANKPPPLTALKTLDTLNEQEIHPIPKNTEV